MRPVKRPSSPAYPPKTIFKIRCSLKYVKSCRILSCDPSRPQLGLRGEISRQCCHVFPMLYPVLCFCSLCLLPCLAICFYVDFLCSMCFICPMPLSLLPLSLLPGIWCSSLPTCILCFLSSLSVGVWVCVHAVSMHISCCCFQSTL